MSRRTRFGMVGGGAGAFIGAVHRNAAWLDGELELVCGAFSSDAANSRATGDSLGLPADRSYPDYTTMLDREAALPPDRRMEFVAIVTPNVLHFPIAAAALARGFHVLSDKPATMSLAECRALQAAVKRSGLLYGLTHTYTSYPLVVEARARVAAGALGTVRKVIVEYTQGWLAEPIERTGHRQASWRLDPARAGASSCFGDIGVHAFNLAEYVTGLRVTALGVELNRVVPGRVLDDDGTALLRFDNGASGVLVASQICTGEENRLCLRVYGERGGLEWHQEEPNTLWLKYSGKPAERLRAGQPYLGRDAAAHMRTPAGHPEGYLEAFANIYRKFASQVRDFDKKTSTPRAPGDVPGIDAALRGMAFIDVSVAVAASPQKWHQFPEVSA